MLRFWRWLVDRRDSHLRPLDQLWLGLHRGMHKGIQKLTLLIHSRRNECSPWSRLSALRDMWHGACSWPCFSATCPYCSIRLVCPGWECWVFLKLRFAANTIGISVFIWTALFLKNPDYRRNWGSMFPYFFLSCVLVIISALFCEEMYFLIGCFYIVHCMKLVCLVSNSTDI